MNYSNLIEWAMFTMKVFNAMPAQCVTASKADGAPWREAKVSAAHWTIEVVRPLWRLNWHSITTVVDEVHTTNIIIKELYIKYKLLKQSYSFD